MKQQIKESYDQIHAPISLINETKQLVHTQIEQEEPLKQKRRATRKWIPVAASLAACLCLCITGITVLHHPAKTKTTIPDNPVVVGQSDMNKEGEFKSIASADTWKTDLQEMKASGKSSIAFDQDYILYEMPLKLEGKDYQVQIQIKQGTLVNKNSEYYLEGTYECVVTDGTKILGTNKLPLTSSTQFTQDKITVLTKGDSSGGTEDFMLNQQEADGSAKDVWYQIGRDFTVTTGSTN